VNATFYEAVKFDEVSKIRNGFFCHSGPLLRGDKVHSSQIRETGEMKESASIKRGQKRRHGQTQFVRGTSRDR
jgi:hypothetical protein